jgi:hypothetical protein
LAFRGTGLVEIIILASVEVLREQSFSDCKSLSSVAFESGSRLSRIEKEAFGGIGLFEVILPASVEVLGLRCFSECKSLSSVTFESGSKLLENEREVLHQAGSKLRNSFRVIHADHFPFKFCYAAKSSPRIIVLNSTKLETGENVSPSMEMKQ